MSENDYKYVIQDVSRVFIGANYTFGELAEHEDIPYRIQAITEKILLPEYEDSCVLSEELKSMEAKDKLFTVMKRLKIKVRGGIVERRDTNAGSKTSYKSRLMKFEEFDQLRQEKSESGVQKELLIEEISFSKLAMMSYPL